jgi:protein gp37
MSTDNTKIEWTDATWGPVRGCSRVSDGCTNCYAMSLAHRFAGPGKLYDGLTTIRRGKVDWSGVVRLIPEQLAQPLRWKKPRRIFVNSMSDLFHESLTNEEIAAVFGVMAAAPQHTFQVLTKRPKRAAEWFKWVGGKDGYSQNGALHVALCDAMQGQVDWDLDDRHCEELLSNANEWPLHNVWLGVSTEDQKTADERIPLLLELPAAVRFISAEPLLGSLNLMRLRGKGIVHRNALTGFLESSDTLLTRDALPGLDWVIVGGESGNGARPFHVDWARSIVGQCRDAGVACFVKQLGARPFRAGGEDETLWGPTVRGREGDALDMPGEVRLDNRKGGDMSEWPTELRVRQFPEVRGG